MKTPEWVRVICWMVGMFFVAAGSYAAIASAQAEQRVEIAIIKQKVERIEKHLEKHLGLVSCAESD